MTSAASLTAVVKPSPTHVVVLRGRRPGPVPERAEPVSREAQRFAAAVLEVLAGVRAPADAATALGISVPRYYLGEQRALAGLVAACEPRPDGRGTGPRWQIAMLEKEVARLKQECARQQALVRAAQRTIGLAPPPASKPAPKAVGKTVGKKPCKRRSAVRALKVAAALRAAPTTEEIPASSPGMPSPEVLQRSVVNSPSSPATPTPLVAAASGG